jgi:phage terminase large subunit-like protein
MRLAAARYLKDRKRAAERSAPWRFSHVHVQQVCEFIELLPHVEGKWDSDSIILHPFQVFFLANVFGFRTREDGGRRFTMALLAIARKNAKSTLAAAVLLYCLCYEDEEGAQCITAATTGDQARIIFKICKRMLDKRPDLTDAFGLQSFADSVVYPDIGGNLRPINAHASTQDGLNPSHVALDEIHAHKDPDLLNVLQSAAGARQNPLWLFTTTEGYETPGPWPELRRFAQQVLEGLLEADHFFPLIFAIDDEIGNEGDEGYQPGDDDFDESKWIKANPLLPVSNILQREIRKAAIQAKAMPSTHAEFRIKRLNRQSASARAWLNIDRWKRCAEPVDLKALERHKCWAAIDGAATTDIFSCRFVWQVGDQVHTWGMRWVPEEQVALRKERGTVPYTGWVEAGYLRTTPGSVLDYERILREMEEQFDRFTPELVAYDPWNFRVSAARLTERNYPMVEFRQGYQSFNPAMKEAERLFLPVLLRHGGDPVLNWCMSNIVPRNDENLNVAPDRKKSADKIDDGVALIMAVGAMVSEEQPNVHDGRLVVV